MFNPHQINSKEVWFWFDSNYFFHFDLIFIFGIQILRGSKSTSISFIPRVYLTLVTSCRGEIVVLYNIIYKLYVVLNMYSSIFIYFIFTSWWLSNHHNHLTFRDSLLFSLKKRQSDFSSSLLLTNSIVTWYILYSSIIVLPEPITRRLR